MTIEKCPNEFHSRISSFKELWKAKMERLKARKEANKLKLPEFRCSLTPKGNPKITFRKSARPDKWLTTEEINFVVKELKLNREAVLSYMESRKIEIRNNPR